MTLDDHRRGFTAAMGALIGEFNGYLDRAQADPYRDGVSYRQFVLWLSEEERQALQSRIWKVLAGLLARQPAADRAPYLLSTIFFPMERPPAAPRKSSRR